jgi:hypothetical protein
MAWKVVYGFTDHIIRSEITELEARQVAEAMAEETGDCMIVCKSCEDTWCGGRPLEPGTHFYKPLDFEDDLGSGWSVFPHGWTTIGLEGDPRS